MCVKSKRAQKKKEKGTVKYSNDGTVCLCSDHLELKLSFSLRMLMKIQLEHVKMEKIFKSPSLVMNIWLITTKFYDVIFLLPLI